MKNLLTLLIPILLSCGTTHVPTRVEIIDSYHMYPTDAQVADIDDHYYSQDEWVLDTVVDAHSTIGARVGRIYVGEEHDSFDIPVYRDNSGSYIWEWSPVTGTEWKHYLSRDQERYIIRL